MAEKSQRGAGPNAAEVMQAINVLVENMVGDDLRSLQSAVENLSNSLSQQVEVVRKEAVAGVDALRKEMNVRFTELAQSIESVRKVSKDANSANEERLTKVSGTLNQDMQKRNDELKELVAATKSTIMATMSNQQQGLRGELDIAKSSITQQASDLMTIRSELARATLALGKMARVFSGADLAVAEPAGQGVSSPAVAAPAPARSAPVTPTPVVQPTSKQASRPLTENNTQSLPESGDVMQHMDKVFNL